jgi:hypothetical protein
VNTGVGGIGAAPWCRRYTTLPRSPMMVLVVRRYGMTIFCLLLAAGSAAWAIEGVVRGNAGPLIFGFLMLIVFVAVALINSPRGIERGYYRLVYRAVTRGRGHADRR